MDITVETLLRHGTLIVFAWVFAVQVGVPIPTAPLLMAVGALGSLGKLSLGWALVGALGGSLVADLLWYGIGRRWGHWIRRTTAADRARDLFLVHRRAWRRSPGARPWDRPDNPSHCSMVLSHCKPLRMA